MHKTYTVIFSEAGLASFREKSRSEIEGLEEAQNAAMDYVVETRAVAWVQDGDTLVSEHREIIDGFVWDDRLLPMSDPTGVRQAARRTLFLPGPNGTSAL